MKKMGFKEMEDYVLNRQNTVAQYILMRPILDLCKETAQIIGTWVLKRWWEQEGLYMAGLRVMVVEVVEEEKEGGGLGRDKA